MEADHILLFVVLVYQRCLNVAGVVSSEDFDRKRFLGVFF